MGLAVNVERAGDEFTITATIPALRNGGANLGAMQAALNSLTAINPQAFDPVPVPVDRHHATEAPMPPLIPEAMAVALMRDQLADDDEGAPGEPPRCRTGACDD